MTNGKQFGSVKPIMVKLINRTVENVNLTMILIFVCQIRVYWLFEAHKLTTLTV